MYALRREQGRLAEVVDSVKRAVDDYPAYPIWRYVLADVLAGLGRRHEAGQALDALAAEDFEVQVEMQWLACLSLLPDVCRDLGAVEPAERLHEALLPYALHNATTPPELCLGSVSRGLGILATMMSDWDTAERHFEDALEMNTRIGCAPLARAHVLRLRAHAAASRSSRRSRAGARARRRCSAPSRTSWEWRCCRRGSSSCSGARHRFASGVRRRRRRTRRPPAPPRPARTETPSTACATGTGFTWSCSPPRPWARSG